MKITKKDTAKVNTVEDEIEKSIVRIRERIQTLEKPIKMIEKDVKEQFEKDNIDDAKKLSKGLLHRKQCIRALENLVSEITCRRLRAEEMDILRKTQHELLDIFSKSKPIKNEQEIEKMKELMLTKPPEITPKEIVEQLTVTLQDYNDTETEFSDDEVDNLLKKIVDNEKKPKKKVDLEKIYEP